MGRIRCTREAARIYSAPGRADSGGRSASGGGNLRFFTGRKILITQRAKGKTSPLLWETAGGSLLAGETPLQGAIRELREETGLVVPPERMQPVYTGFDHPTAIFKNFAAYVKGDEPVVLQAGETVDYQWMPLDAFWDFIQTGAFVPKTAAAILTHQEELMRALNILRARFPACVFRKPHTT